jgi:hypothetical protein
MFPSVSSMPAVVGDYCRIDNRIAVRQAGHLAVYSEVCAWQAE